MADDPQQTAKGPKGFRNRLKKAFRLGLQSKEAAKFAEAAKLAEAEAAKLAEAEATKLAEAEAEKLAEAAKLRAKYSRFRILVIGRANAGKTTLLKRVCNTTEDPCIYDEDKNLVSHSLIVRSRFHHFFTNSSNRPRRCRRGDIYTTIRSDD